MNQVIETPWIIRWLAAILWTLPGPTDAWATIVASLAWPSLILFLVLRFRHFIRNYLGILAARLETDDFKFGPFELRSNDQVVRLKADADHDSTQDFGLEDIGRIERLFEFISEQEGWDRLVQWISEAGLERVTLVDLVNLPEYAELRARAFIEIEGLQA